MRKLLREKAKKIGGRLEEEHKNSPVKFYTKGLVYGILPFSPTDLIVADIIVNGIDKKGDKLDFERRYLSPGIYAFMKVGIYSTLISSALERFLQ